MTSKTAEKRSVASYAEELEIPQPALASTIPGDACKKYVQASTTDKVNTDAEDKDEDCYELTLQDMDCGSHETDEPGPECIAAADTAVFVVRKREKTAQRRSSAAA